MNLNKYIKSHILSKLVKEEDRKVGIEVECFIYTKNYKRLNVNSLNEYEDIMNNLRLDRPEMMDFNVPANVKGMTLEKLKL